MWVPVQLGWYGISAVLLDVRELGEEESDEDEKDLRYCGEDRLSESCVEEACHVPRAHASLCFVNASGCLCSSDRLEVEWLLRMILGVEVVQRKAKLCPHSGRRWVWGERHCTTRHIHQEPRH